MRAELAMLKDSEFMDDTLRLELVRRMVGRSDMRAASTVDRGLLVDRATLPVALMLSWVEEMDRMALRWSDSDASSALLFVLRLFSSVGVATMLCVSLPVFLES
jgi:hypothetical protein